MKRRIAQLPLHSGKAPPWLFKRMTKLAGAVTMAIVEEFGPAEMLRRLSDPWWFQAFGCVLGFDWHSSGVTTVTCGALKEAAKVCGPDLGILVAGGKGATSRKTPQEIAEAAQRHAITSGQRLVYASRTSAKVDSAAVQDGFALYHHSFFFTPDGRWCVVQQGMDAGSGWARRYHWLGESVEDFVCEPHAAVQDLAERPAETTPGGTGSGPRQLTLLNMVAAEAGENRRASAALVREPPGWLTAEIERLTEGPTLFAPSRHAVLELDVDRARLNRILTTAHEQNPQDFETLLGLQGIGPATVRSLALLAEIIFQAPPARRDPTGSKDAGHDLGSQIAIGSKGTVPLKGTVPFSSDENWDSPPDENWDSPREESAGNTRRWADYSYAHGGKDGTPFPVDRDTYDRNITVLADAVRKARLGQNDKLSALRRLSNLGRV
ncbi:MAG: DUF763 domain-containing protein [Thermoguttaceae bacterium]